jgi:hypothetical protein
MTTWGGRRALPLGLMAVVAGLALLPSAADASTVTAQSEQNLVTAAERRAVGVELNAWPDTPMGVEKTGTGGAAYTFYAANTNQHGRGDIARTVGALNDPIAAGVEPNLVVQGAREQIPDLGYAGGGPTYDASYQGLPFKLMFVHLEQYPDGIPAHGIYGSIGLAKSTDGGHTWQFLGQIFQEDRGYDQFADQESNGLFCGDNSNTAVGVGEYVIRSEGGVDYFYIYSPDWPASCEPGQGTGATFAAARAPVSDVVAAAAGGGVSPWSKYDDPAWDQPALGGQSSDVLGGGEGHFRSFSVSYNSYVDRYIMLQSVLTGSSLQQGVSFRDSCDGVHWSAPTTIFTEMGEIYDPSIIGIGADPRTTDHNFYVYYSHSLDAVLGGDRWQDGSLRRRPLSILPSGPCPT